jgi:outer membrane protein assembly factor BamA
VDSISASNTVSGGPIDAMVYSLSDPAVRIHQLRVDGVSAVAQNKVDIVRQAYIGTDFDRLSGIAIQRRLQDAYRDLGFLDITIDTAAHSAPTIEPKQIFVDVSTAAHEGSQYHIVRIDYPASTIVSPATFENGAALKPGDPAAQYLIGQITQRIDHEFHRRGYLDEETQLAEKKDTTAHTVAYSYTVEPGDLYHFKGITLPGATEEQQKAFDRAWALKPGAPLDRDYVMLFFQKIGDLATFHGYTAKPAFAPNRNDHTVQITAPVLKADSSGH